MGRHCAAVGCTNNSKQAKEKNLTFHRFPLHDLNTLRKWLVKLRRKDFFPTEYSALCSVHFNEEDFEIQRFTKTRFLKKGVVPSKFSYGLSCETGTDMESRKAQVHKGVKAFVGKAEKQCNKCGFVTYCLHVLYKHKYKCRGQLLGHPIICVYCKRKFSFVTLYKSHKATCLKKLQKQKYLATKLKQKYLKKQRNKQECAVSSQLSLSCPICQASFISKETFVTHLTKENCESQKKIKKTAFSARKSFNNHKRSRSSSNIYEDEFYPSELQHKSIHSISKDRKKQFRCVYCKSSYPSEKLFLMHLDVSNECAIAYYQSDTVVKRKKTSLTARKTVNVVAKKSFPQKLYKIPNAFSYKKISGSARKTLPSSSRKTLKLYKNYFSKDNSLNSCPVCYKEFPDTYSFFLHQKKMNHWGKATKSMNTTCKCPFCGKEFIHVTSRIAHVRNHNDVSEDKIKAFLRNHTCSICSQVFATELARQQHIRIQHPAHPSNNSAKYARVRSEYNTLSDNEYASKQKMSSVTSAVKKKLKQQPNTCPVCSKAFSHTVLRNKHFNEAHLKIFECQFCNTKFKSISSLNNHIELSHGKDFECRECKIRFKNELLILQHVLKSHPNKDPKLFLPVKSSVSSKEKPKDSASEVIIRDIEKINSKRDVVGKNMEYYCDVCDIGYLKLCGLQRHRQSKLHKDTLEKNLDAVHKSLSDLPTSSANPPKISQPEILTCSECSEDFASVKDFVPHRLSHFSVQSKYLKITELNPYMCEICSDVLDSHSKVQLHLFWHLQVESTASASTASGPSTKETIVPDRLSGQHVAKKSFSKQSDESLQEVVIGGIKKALFTCEACNVGFTTKEHYSMHVRKLCKKKKTYSTSKNKEGSSDKTKSNLLIMDKYVHCDKCNFLFASPAKYDHHKSYCSKCVFNISSEENSCNSDAIKSALNKDIAVAGCVTCGAIFDNVLNTEDHISVHQEDDANSIPEDVPEDVLHCSLCNCLFPLHAFKIHKDFCKIPINTGDKVTNSKHMNVLKSALELKSAVAGCICCGVPFDDLETFEKHLTLHQTNQIHSESFGRNLYNGEEISKDTEGENPSTDHPSEFLLSNNENHLLEFGGDQPNCLESYGKHAKDALDFVEELAKSTTELDEEHLKLSLEFNEDHRKNSLESDEEYAKNCVESDEEQQISNKDSDSNIDSPPEMEEKSLLHSDKHNVTSDNIEELRDNFSQLLCLLISDAELMQTLGYGTMLVEDVLVNVLEQMGQEPCTIKKVSNLERFRKNIQILLDLCLKEQVMEAIGNEKTTDEIVIEALKIFASDESMVDSEELNSSL